MRLDRFQEEDHLKEYLSAYVAAKISYQLSRTLKKGHSL
jgi:hypothetical protein